jgi:hypothetical protein
MSNLKHIVSVSGTPGLKKLVTQRNDGLILSELDGSQKKFYPSRLHMFSPIENISIYTDDGESTLLGEVFDSMRDKMDTTPIPEGNADNNSLKKYMSEILPNYDRDKVNISDIKKLIKWFHILDSAGFTTSEEPIAE